MAYGIAYASAFVQANQSTSSGSYTDLSTVGPSKDIWVPPSGVVRATWKYHVQYPTSGGVGAYVALDLSGANTISSTTNSNAGLVGVANALPNNAIVTITVIHLFTGLTSGTTTFKMQYLSTGGSMTFTNRELILETEA